MYTSIRFRSQWAPLAVALCGLLAWSAAGAQEAADRGYVIAGDGTVARDGQGECIPNVNWTEEYAIEDCHPELVAEQAPAAIPEEPQEVAAAPPQMVRQQVTLETDAYFDFDSAELSEEGRGRLDQLAERFNEVEEPSVRVTGYTDPIGDEEYNRQLSRERAEAVKDYLVQAGVAQEAIEVAGRGEEAPVVNCEGRSGQELIECLAPDRRSEISFAAFEVVEQPAEGTEPADRPMSEPEGTDPMP